MHFIKTGSKKQWKKGKALFQKPIPCCCPFNVALTPLYLKNISQVWNITCDTAKI
jgi:hypothetical protein